MYVQANSLYAMPKWILLYLLLCFDETVNEENDCACAVNRSPAESLRNGNYENFFQRYGHENKQCALRVSSKYYEQLKVTNSMVLVPGGNYQLGTNDVVIEGDREGPMRDVELKSFYLDKYEVSNRDFSKFTKFTDYKTDAEIFGDSFVFTLFLNSSFRETMKDYRVVQAPWWYKIFGANWRHPSGPESNIFEVMDHPVIHVSWQDAQAYCKWRDARLPTEAEWEAACRGGKRNTKYPWGNKLFPDRTHMANIWQGTFPNYNSKKDGYIGTNPVHMFQQNKFGLHNIAGNVWEWTQDSWAGDNSKEKVKKGGSYLCHRSYCYRYRCSARSHNTEDSSAGNLGFRCAKSLT